LGQDLYRRGRRAAVIAAALGLVGLLLAPVASAQTIVSETYDSFGNVTSLDTAGNTYTFNVSGVPTVGTSTVGATLTPPLGSASTSSFAVQGLGGNLYFVTGSAFGGAAPVSCTVNTATMTVVSGNCGPIFPANGAATVVYTPGLGPVLVASPNLKKPNNSVNTSANSITREQTVAATSLISGHIRAVTRGFALSAQPFAANRPVGVSYHGVSAGSSETPWGVWGDVSGSFLENNSKVGYDGTSVVALAGIDYFLDDNWLVGLSSGYARADVTLRSFTGTRSSNGAVVAPYVSYIINSNFSADAQFNYTALSNRLASPAPGVSSNFDGDRLTGAANLNGFTDIDPYRLTGFVGYAYTWEGSGRSTLNFLAPSATNIHIGLVKVGGEIGRVFGDWEVYLPITFEYETTTPRDGTSRPALIVGGGVRYQWSDTVKAGLLATTTQIKNHTQDVLVGANLRISF